MGLDQDLRAVYPDGRVCYIREWRKNHLLRTCVRTLVPSYVDNGTTTMSRQDLDNVVVALERWRRDGDGPTVDTPDCWYKNLKGNDDAEGLWSFEEQREQALEGLREAASHIDAEKFVYWEWY